MGQTAISKTLQEWIDEAPDERVRAWRADLVDRAFNPSRQDEPTETECDMCGKPGASPRSDGSFMCSYCWMVWRA